MLSIFLVVLLFGLLLLGFPVFLALAIPAVLSLIIFQDGIDYTIIVQRMISGVNSFTLLALPLFVFAADIIAKGEMGDRIVKFAQSLVGHFKGGPAIMVILASLVFGSISGSGTASMLALGGVFLSALSQGNYPNSFSYGLISVSSSLSSLVPPGIAMILYATIVGESVKEVFLVGLSVGILFGIALGVYGIFYSIKNKLPTSEKFDLKYSLEHFKRASLVLFTPIIILGGIYGGFVTPTEAAALAVLYIFIIEAFVYKSFKVKEIFNIAFESAKTSVMILILIAAGTLLSWVMAVAQIPQTIGLMLSDVPDGVVLLLITLVFLTMGMFMDGFSAMVILVPIVLPLVQKVGMDLSLFGLLVVLNTAIGTNTPPFGIHIFAGMSKFKIKFETMVRSLIPYLIISIVFLFMITYFPQIPMWLPNFIDYLQQN